MSCSLEFSTLTPRSSKFLTVFLLLTFFLGFDKAKLKSVETYLKAVKLFRHDQDNSGEPTYSQVHEKQPPVTQPPGSGCQQPCSRGHLSLSASICSALKREAVLNGLNTLDRCVRMVSGTQKLLNKCPPSLVFSQLILFVTLLRFYSLSLCRFLLVNFTTFY